MSKRGGSEVKRVTIVEPSLHSGSENYEGEGTTDNVSSVGSQESIESMEESVGDDLVKVTFTDIIPLGFFVDYFENFGDEDFVQAVDNIVQEHRHLKCENDIFIRYIMESEPTLMANLEHLQKRVKELAVSNPILPRFFDVPEEGLTAETMLYTLGPQINVSTRSDLVSRYVDEYKQKMQEFECEMEIQSKRLAVAIEEAAIRIDETNDAVDAFETNIVIGAVDPVTQRIPAEKWQLFTDGWMKSARFIIERIRLNTSYMKTEYAQLKALHERKMELGDTLTNTDFEDLRLRNENLEREIEHRSNAMVKLKQSSAQANLDLCLLRLQLLDLKNIEEKLHEDVGNEEQMRLELLKEIAASTKVLAIEKAELERVQHMIERCQAPEVLEYVRVKQKQMDLVKQHKILCRKEHLLNMQMRTEERNLLAITHRKKVHAQWYEPIKNVSGEDSTQNSNENVCLIPEEIELFHAISIKNVSSEVKTSESEEG